MLLEALVADPSFDLFLARRALLAGGFGTGKGWSGDERALEIAPVVQSGMEPVMTEAAKRHQRTHFQRRYPLSPPPGTPQKYGGDGDEERKERLDEPVSSSSDGGSSSGAGDERRDGINESDLEAALGDVAQKAPHMQGNLWAHQIPGDHGLHLEAPVVSNLFPRFHLDLTSAVAAAVGKSDW